MEQSQKNNRDFLYVISLLLVAIVLISLGLVFWGKNNVLEKKQSKVVNEKILSDQEIVQLVDGPYEQIDEDRLVFNVSQNTDGPKITKVIIAPQKVSRGEEQYLEVWVNDEQGVQSVQTETELDGGFIKKLDMELFEGDTKNGKWRVTWVVHDTHDETYTTKFIATSIDGRQSDDYFNWLDPCSPNITGDWFPENGEVCDVSGVIGTDGGNIILADGVSITIKSGTTVVFNPNKEIILRQESVINLEEGAVIQKGYLYVSDFDGDGQAVSGTGLPGLTSVTTTPSVPHPATGRQGLNFGNSININWKTRLSAMRSPMQGDCYDNQDTAGARNTFSGQTQFFTEPSGRGGAIAEWDYDCNGIKQFGDEYWGTCVGGIEFEQDKHWTDYYGGCQTKSGGWFYCEETSDPPECGRPTNPAMHIWFDNGDGINCGPESYLLTGNALETVTASCK